VDRNGLAVTLAFYAAEAAESTNGVEDAD
jgi:hypothetical protein